MKHRQRHGLLIAFFGLLTALLLLYSIAKGALPATCGRASPAFEEELLERINQYRADNGLKPLSRHKALDALAKHHSKDMCKEETLSHDGFSERFHQSGKRRCVENVGWNCASAAEQFDLWKGSPGHDHNLLDRGMGSAGISRIGPYVTFFACE